MQIRTFKRMQALPSRSPSRGLTVIEILMLVFIAALVVIVIWTLLSDTAIPQMKKMVEKVFGFSV